MNSISTTITIDYSIGAIIFKTKKICFYFSISKFIDINKIKQVIVKNDFSTKFKTGRHTLHFAFEVHFKLIDGNKIVGCSGLMDRNSEGKKVFLFLKVYFLKR